MKQFFFCMVLFGYLGAAAQVGIGNTDPKASLDIIASNTATPANTDGILIPRIDDFPVVNPAADQDGMMVFVTGNSTPPKGFYYWDNGTTAWVPVVGTKNTLGQGYNEGGAGAGRIITANDGAVRINGEDGFEITGTYGSGNDLSLTGTGTRLFFNPKKAAFRVGFVIGSIWDNSNIGNYSFATNYNTQASGDRAFATGSTTVASGLYSFSQGLSSIASGVGSSAFGISGVAPSWGEFTIGLFPTTYTVPNNWTFEPNERVFTVGNGTGTVARSNALTIYKSGLMNINDEYNMPLTDGSSGEIMSTDGSGQVSFVDVSTLISGTDTQNTLDEAYNEGSAGAGRIITANDGAVSINGEDGFEVTGTYGSGDDLTLSGTGTRMFFNPKKAAFRAGYVIASTWNSSNIGNYSFATNYNTSAEGEASFSANSYSTASGRFSASFGRFSEALSYTEMAIGSYPTLYTPASAFSFNILDRAFVIGNSTTTTGRSNAFEVWKDGRVIINEAYTLPITDGTINQVLTTDGSGNVSWAATSGGSITASNGLTEVSNDIQLGGTLSQNTTIDFGDFNTAFNLSSNGDFHVQDSGTNIFTIEDNGETTFGQDTYWRDNNTDGTSTALGRFFDSGNSGTFDIYASGLDSVRLRGSGDSYFSNSLAIGDTSANPYRLHVTSPSTNRNYIANFLQLSTDPIAAGVSIRLTASPSSGGYYLGMFRLTNTEAGKINGFGAGVQYATTSDRRLKMNIEDISNALELLGQIEPQLYEFKEFPGIKEYGFIAQDLQKIYPQAVAGSPDSDPTKNPMMVDYSRLTPILTAGLKELIEEMEALKIENATLKAKLNQLENLEARILALENTSETTRAKGIVNKD